MNNEEFNPTSDLEETGNQEEATKNDVFEELILSLSQTTNISLQELTPEDDSLVRQGALALGKATNELELELEHEEEEEEEEEEEKPEQDIVPSSASLKGPEQTIALGAVDTESNSIGEQLRLLEQEALDAAPDLSKVVPNAQLRQEIITAILFASANPIRLSDLRESCGWSMALLQKDLAMLPQTLAPTGLQLQRVAGALRITTAAQTSFWVERHLQKQNFKSLPKPQLETLAIVAYRQPVSRAEIDAYRGVKSDRAVRQLEELNLIEEIGHSALPGHPALFGTTKEFLQYVSLESLDALPKIQQNGLNFKRAQTPPDFRRDDQGLGVAVNDSSLPLLESDGANLSPESASTATNTVAGEDGIVRLGPSSGLRKLFDKIRKRNITN